MDSTIKFGYSQIVRTAITTLRPLQERVCSLADKYLDTSVAYSTQAANHKNKFLLICELVRYSSNHRRCTLITVDRPPRNFQSFSDLKIAGLYMIIYASTSRTAHKRPRKTNKIRIRSWKLPPRAKVEVRDVTHSDTRSALIAKIELVCA